jgi:hypothetical protein
MSKAKSWILIVLCAAGLLSLTSCAKNNYAMLVNYEESGWYPVDVAKWTAVREQGGDFTYWYTVKDGTAEFSVAYVDPGSYYPTYPTSHALMLQSYTVNWKGTVGQKPPNSSGQLNVLVPLDVSGGTEVKVKILVVPAGNKDTSTVLSDLRGDPESDPNTFVGQLVSKAEITLRGKDIATNADVEATLELTAAFADYVDPNDYH